MSFVITNPEALTVAATEVRRIRDRAIQSDAQVAPMTTAVRPPAADLVSEKAATRSWSSTQGSIGRPSLRRRWFLRSLRTP